MDLLSGGELLVKSLQAEGVDTIFGYPGGALLNVYDALYGSSLKHILVRHEQAAAHAADGYARATGRPGVVLVTSGPGATNIITGIATAHMDSIPLIVISGQVPSAQIGEDAFQETDMLGLSRPIVKHSFAVRSADEIPLIIKKAFYIATTGRKGPVVIDLPKDMTDPGIKFPYSPPEPVKLRTYSVPTSGHFGQIKKAVELVYEAKQPVIYAGGGVVQGEASDVLTQFARELGIPVTTTLMGLGAFPATDPLWIGMLGMYGFYEANNAMHSADVIVAVGARFDDRVTNSPAKFCPKAKIIHIDIDPSSIAKIIKADIPIVGPADAILLEMLNQAKKLCGNKDAVRDEGLKKWWKKIESWRQEGGLLTGKRYKANDTYLKPQDVIKAVYHFSNGGDFVTSDVGLHQMFAAQYYSFDQPRRWINSGGLGTMGFGLPAAMGVQLAFPDSSVICVTGEGSIQMNIQELSTCTQYGLPIKIINLNNGYLGMVKQWQDMEYEGRHSQISYADSLPDFVKLAESYGHVGVRIKDPAELDEKLGYALGLKDRLVFIDILVDPEEHVYPIQVAKGAMCDMWIGKNKRVLGCAE